MWQLEVPRHLSLSVGGIRGTPSLWNSAFPWATPGFGKLSGPQDLLLPLRAVIRWGDSSICSRVIQPNFSESQCLPPRNEIHDICLEEMAYRGNRVIMRVDEEM